MLNEAQKHWSSLTHLGNESHYPVKKVLHFVQAVCKASLYLLEVAT